MENKKFKPPVSTTITAKDMNGVDKTTGQGTVSKHGQTDNLDLKGSLDKYNRSQSILYNEAIFVNGIINQLMQYMFERFDYTGLPEPITKYRFERKLLENGSAVLFEKNGLWVIANYAIQSFNMYNEPIQIVVVEPKAPMLNGVKLNLATDKAKIIRSNYNYESPLQWFTRYIKQLEKILYQLEKNVLASAPKGVVNVGNNKLISESNNENSTKQSLEKIINSEDTFYSLIAGEDNDFNPLTENTELFVPLEFTDKTENLIKNYTFIKEQLKELVGASVNIHQKQERAVVGEIDGQQGFSTSALQHSFNIREIDLKDANKTLGLNIEIEYLPDIRPEDELQPDDPEQKDGE